MIAGGPIRILVVDDEPVAREGVRRMLADDPEIAEVRTCASGPAGLRELKGPTGFDLLLVDVQMPGMSGLEMIEAYGQDRAPVVVFLTAYDQYAIQAFESGAVDYLLKPFSDERLAKALERAKRQISQRRLTAGTHAGADHPHGRLERLLVRSIGTITFVRAEEIDWIEAADYYAVVHTGGKEHLVRISMRRLERSLDPRAFVRVHRNAIIRVDRIRELRHDHEGGLEVELRDGTRVAVSRRLRDRLRDRVLRGD
jgi:two-component system LytT family response regulator